VKRVVVTIEVSSGLTDAELLLWAGRALDDAGMDGLNPSSSSVDLSEDGRHTGGWGVSSEASPG
jgi:hypothetical protein